MPRSDQLSRRPLVLPPGPWPDLVKLTEEYRRLIEERRLTALGLDALTADRAKAVKADVQAHARAIRDAKADPGTRNTKRVDDELAASRRRFDALTTAVADTEDELLGLVENNRAAWAADADERAAATRAGFAEALSALDAARHQLAEAEALGRWVVQFPRAKSYAQLDPHVALTAPSGDPYTAGALIAALADLAAEPEPATVSRARPSDQAQV